MDLSRTFESDVQVVTREDGTQRLEGYAALYYDGTPATEFPISKGRVERISRGAFKDVLAGSTVLGFGHGNDLQVLDSLERSLELVSDDKGLRFSSPFDETDPDYQRARAKIQKGIVRGCSFAATAPAHRWEKDGDKYVGWLDGFVALHDVALVARPAYKNTFAYVRDASDVAEIDASFEQYLTREVGVPPLPEVPAEEVVRADEIPVVEVSAPVVESQDVVRELETRVQQLERELTEAKKLLTPRSMPTSGSVGLSAMSKEQRKAYWASL